MVDIDLQWGSVRGEQFLPILTVGAIPTEGMEILLTRTERRSDVMFFNPEVKTIHYSVKVEKVVLDAEDREDPGFIAYVIPS